MASFLLKHWLWWGSSGSDKGIKAVVDDAVVLEVLWQIYSSGTP